MQFQGGLGFQAAFQPVPCGGAWGKTEAEPAGWGGEGADQEAGAGKAVEEVVGELGLRAGGREEGGAADQVEAGVGQQGGEAVGGVLGGRGGLLAPFGIGQGLGGDRDRGAVDGPGAEGFADGCGGGWRGEGEAEAEAGEAVGFAEGAEDDRVGEREAGGEAEGGLEVGIGFVDDEEG